jgi:hypothetical protein
MAVMTQSQAEPRSGNEQTADVMAGGMPWSRIISSVMMPSVPSAPTKRRVMS